MAFAHTKFTKDAELTFLLYCTTSETLLFLAKYEETFIVDMAWVVLLFA